MTSEEVEKEFEEWWVKRYPVYYKGEIYDLEKAFALRGYLEAHSRQEKRIERLKEGVKLAMELSGNFWLNEKLQKLLEEKDE